MISSSLLSLSLSCICIWLWLWLWIFGFISFLYFLMSSASKMEFVLSNVVFLILKSSSIFFFWWGWKCVMVRRQGFNLKF